MHSCRRLTDQRQNQTYTEEDDEKLGSTALVEFQPKAGLEEVDDIETNGNNNDEVERGPEVNNKLRTGIQ